MSYFITIEGPEGSGKTTVIKAITEQLQKHKVVVTTREPGGIKISEDIRTILLDEANAMDYRTEALLFAASRRQHLIEKVLPALKRGEIVICDRFIDSSLAYQGYARGIGMDEIRTINEFAIEGKYPDLTLYLKVSAHTGLQRIKDNSRETNRLDKESISFHKSVVAGYDKLAQAFPERIKVVDAEQSVDKVVEESMKWINQLLN
ncbi:dTMP kinase [Macrococcus armenti]|uniref:dTMP kinase n=1 Tax=Macrococcus armenti TaxID=2875764 RepID=UPI001CCF1D3A|nr:dTMP kinase [Macrococcus armenti]UBH13089.1 dTMP kinase [Macrococcus armenti]